MESDILSLTLNWDKPSNVKTAEEVTAYDIRFRPAGRWWIQGYHKMIMDSSATSVVLTRENGLNPLTTYEFEVRTRNDHCEGEWSKVSKYIGIFIVYEILKLKIDKQTTWGVCMCNVPFTL